MVTVLAFLVFGILVGGVTMFFVRRLANRRMLLRARTEAQRIVDEAKEEAENLMDEAKLSADEAADEVWTRYEAELTQLETRVKELEEKYRKRRSESDRTFNQDSREIQKQAQALQDHEKKMAERQQSFENLKSKILQNRRALIAELQAISGVDSLALKSQLADQFEHQIRADIRRKYSEYEEEVRANAEEMAKRLISIALARFPRAACTERGIGIVEIPNEDVKRRMLGPDGLHINRLQEWTGLEIIVNEHNAFSVIGFDPVQRETATRTLEKLLHERNPNEETVRRLFEKTKSDVAKKIESDGSRVASELGQKDLHPEIKKMLGQLRYRYSFAQNQHYHVAEVGWLCGLLASELGSVDIRLAKRSGLLHDLGKAMDHAIEGGHAVIGADFIKKHGEQDDVVHAVRAHHYEEQPSTDMAFLVIAADAMSGARPGARRSTVTVYNQKIEALTTIAEGFRGVTKTLILNAGREVRILVDGRRVNDEQSLKLCRDIADKIEDECQYPGQIKVVVIRETHAEAMAK